MKLKERYEKLYNNMKSGKYDIAVADENTFEMKVNISFIELLKDCEKEGVSIKKLLKYARERDANNEHYKYTTSTGGKNGNYL